MIENSQHHSLLEVLQSVQRMFERYWKKPLWVKAEMTKLNFYPHSGHAYPLLMEKKEGKTVAEIRSTVWATDLRRITTKFETVTKKEFSDGIELLLLVEVNYTPAHSISLKIIDVDPTYTLGAMEKERQITIKKLKIDNLFDKNKGINFPVLPKRIAVISVETSKGFHDFENTLTNNSKGYKIDYELFPALLQGNKAIESIRRQLDAVRQRKKEFDVVAIIRGGGGEVGLNCYDSFNLSSAVAQFPLPIITGIGHATNLTVVEMVSSKNLITPTALANFILEKFDTFNSRLKTSESNLAFYSEKIIKDKHISLQSLSGVFETDVLLLLQKEKHLVGNLVDYIKLSSDNLLKKQNEAISSLSMSLKYLIRDRVQKNNFKIDNYSKSLKNIVVSKLKNQEQNLSIFESKVNLLNPENILKRGYSITRVNGKAKDISRLKKGDLLEIETYISKIRSTVTKIDKK